MNTLYFCRELAKLLAASEVQKNPKETFEEFTFPGREVGLGKGEFVIVTYKRRKIEGIEDAAPLPEARYTGLDE